MERRIETLRDLAKEQTILILYGTPMRTMLCAMAVSCCCCLAVDRRAISADPLVYMISQRMSVTSEHVCKVYYL